MRPGGIKADAEFGDAAQQGERGQLLTLSKRAFLLGLLLIPPMVYWVELMEIKWNVSDGTCVSIFFAVIFALFVLALLNRLVARYLPRFAFSQGELVLIYVMLSCAVAVAGHDMMGNALPNLQNLFWFDTPENRWDEMQQYVPEWFSIRDKDVLKGFYLGESSIWAPDHLLPWLKMMGVWGGFLAVVIFVMICINVILRRQWTEVERLTYPLMQLPLEMTSQRKDNLWTNKVMWLGFAIPFLIENMNAFHYLYPAVPSVQIKLYDLGQFFTSRPWNGMGWTPISFYPFAIGFIFFLPTDLAFSCWFFYLLRKITEVVTTAIGWHDPGAASGLARFPYTYEQGSGAWIGLFVFALWASRGHLAEVWNKILGRPTYLDDSNESMSYRMAFAGMVLGFAAIIAFCMAAGMSFGIAVMFFAIYYMLCIAITRVRAELGPPAHETNWVRPEMMVIWTFGTKAIGPANLTIMSYFYWFNRGYRNLVMPHQLEGFKLAELTGTQPKQMMKAIMIACALGIVASFWALLDMYYREGAATARVAGGYRTGIGNYAFDRLKGWLTNEAPIDVPALMGEGFGLFFVLGLVFFKNRFLGWPLHPAGYALAMSYALEYFWFCFFLSWLIKTLLVKYGGVRLYRKAIPFFLGVIIGDYVMASAWALVSPIAGIRTYQFFIF